ncbi:NAD(P)/FAD-dependent oxidoreductase [Cryptosporangium phraense]|uniref:NAD(P)/FAD-dependent oxidoreductase n=1 Tax=Cryptosporangium phraense TaxID=2593070 RepID=UPI00197A8366|nr:FAD-dependent oxidoreductase [Cryptosporangium phraense]
MTTVIAGAGQAGVQVAASLRQTGYAERILLIGDEPVLPYQRPPLSKSYLLGTTTQDSLNLRPQTFYEAQSIDLLTGVQVSGVDLTTTRAELDDGTHLHWDHLVLATGARPRQLGIPGETLAGVFPLRSLHHAQHLAEQIRSAREVVVIGGGFIGLEIASALGATIAVTVLEGASRLMGRAVTVPTSDYFAEQHTARGAQLRFGVTATEILGAGGRVTGVRASDGRVYAADLVVVGAGVVPDTTLAEKAGLATDNGIVVDASLRTSHPQVFAIGDCARFPDAGTGRLQRLESVQNATGHADHVAREITGTPGIYQDLPWFWSDQKGLRLQIAGLATGHDSTAVLGEPASGKFSVVAFRAGRLIAVESINRPADYQAARKLLASATWLSQDDVTAAGFTLKAAALDLATR